MITLGSMLFASGKADLTPDGHTAVSQLATYLKNYPDHGTISATQQPGLRR